MKKEEDKWYKNKGYLHLTNAYNLTVQDKGLKSKIQDPSFVAKYAFFPLFHINIKNRRYKKSKDGKRSHTSVKNERKTSNAKIRPLHYANHLDAMIFGYYSEILQTNYEKELKNNPQLNAAATAYRRIPIEEGSGKNKSSIHFAKEVFEEVKKRSKTEKEIVVLAFDIKSFFPTLNHRFLYDEWCENIGEDKLPKDHLNVFKAATNFSFINKDQLRAKPKNKNGKRSGFDEKRLAKIRNKYGVNAFFESAQAFRQAIKHGEIRICKNSFRDKDSGEVIGIPQGLPISATLANIYLKKFDLDVLDKLQSENGFYRRYSDDIIVVCRKDSMEQVEKFVIQAIQKYRVEISPDKTEKFIFKNAALDGKERFVSHKIVDGNLEINKPLNYLGFEFYGYQTLIKSANLAKFYRRMIYAVKSKTKRAKKIAGEYPGDKPVVFKNQLIRLYTNQDLDDQGSPRKRRFKTIKKIETGEYRVYSEVKEYANSGNYFSYVKRSAEIMEAPEILQQINGEKARRVFNQALEKWMK